MELPHIKVNTQQQVRFNDFHKIYVRFICNHGI